MSTTRTGWLIGLLFSVAGCADDSKWGWAGRKWELSSSLAVSNATAITIDASYLYWITTDSRLYRVPRTGGSVTFAQLPAAGALLGAHTDLYVGWNDSGGNATIADIDPATGAVVATNRQPGALHALVAGQRGYSFAVDTPNGSVVQTCFEGSCAAPATIESELKGLALDLPTKTFYALTVDGLRRCTLSDGCPADAAAVPDETALVAALPGTYFLLDSQGQASSADGSLHFGAAGASGPTKFVVVDGNGQSPAPIGTWSNGSTLAHTLLASSGITSEIPTACTDFDVDATSSPIYCLVGNSSIQLIP